VPEHIKEYVLNKHKSEIRIAFINGTINGLDATYKGEELTCPDHYYHQTFKGEENG
jgi:hypothetical protein